MPLNTGGHLSVHALGVPSRAFERDGRSVGCHYIPALLGEPDGVGSLPATRVESSPGLEAAHLGHELRIGMTAPDVF